MRLLIAALALGIVGCDHIPGTEEHLITKGQDEAASTLRDPSSAQFRNGRVSSFENGGKQFQAICGEVNGKNAYGAYAGFQRFVSIVDQKMTLIDPEYSVSQKLVDDALLSCKRSVRAMKRGANLPEVAQLECKQAREVAVQWHKQALFNKAYSEVCT